MPVTPVGLRRLTSFGADFPWADEHCLLALDNRYTSPESVSQR